jgi:hypothetical protein
VGQIWAIARQMIAEGIRMRIALVFIALLALIVLGLPFSVEGDSSVAGRVQNFMSFGLTGTSLLLGLLTILLSRSVSEELVNRHIYMTATKPIARWQFIMGKWVGVMAINTTFLLFAGASIYGMVHYLKWSQPPVDPYDKQELEEQILVARHARKVKPPDFRAPAEQEFERRKEEGYYGDRLKDLDVKYELADLTQKYEAAWRSVSYGEVRLFEFENILCERSPDKFLQLRYKTNVEGYESDEVFRAAWIAGDPSKRTDVFQELTKHVVGRYHSVNIPTSCVAPDNTLLVQFQNINPDKLNQNYGPHIQFMPEDEIELLFVVGSFEGNFSRLLVLMWCKLAYLGAFALLATSILSFPVACLTSFTIYALAGMRGFIYESVEWSYETENMFASVGDFLNVALYYVVRTVGAVVPNFSAYDGVETLVAGGNVSLVWVLQGVFWLGLVQTSIVLGLAMLLFHFREVAEVSA